jgi:glutamate synthase (NADPH/NADH) large chain
MMKTKDQPPQRDGKNLSGPNPKLFNWLTAADTKTWLDERDACALVASVRKNGEATHGNLKRALAALSIMGHRCGEVNGEGDGCGVMTDIPRLLWAQALEQEGKPGWLAEDHRFFVGHLMIPNTETDVAGIQDKILNMLKESGMDLLLERPILTRPQALGKMARLQAPHLWQIAGLVRNGPLEHVERTLFDLGLKIEQSTRIIVASLSSNVVVYKVRGSIETLYQFYPELRNPDFTTAITIGHARYSTNTATSFERVQPFSLLGHNGEINTIARLREQAQMIGVDLVDGGSDSQDLDRLLATLIHRYHFSLAEALELAFPPILSEVEKLSPELQTIYKYYRQAFGPFAQGPAGIISRYGDECVFSVDALGLRPLWFGDTEKEYFFSSEKGVYHLDTMRLDPIPLSPGEKMYLRIHRGTRKVEVFDYPSIQQKMLNQAPRRFGSLETINKRLALAPSKAASAPETMQPVPEIRLDNRMSAFGWGREDREWIQDLAKNGIDPISSLGYDGPLAPLSKERQNLSDYFKEAVAVVTNPAIDREREVEHFSTQTVIGARPPLTPNELGQATTVAVNVPIILDNSSAAALLDQVTAESSYTTLDQLVQQFSDEQVTHLQTVTFPGESTAEGVNRIAQTAVEAVRSGAQLIFLDDADSFRGQNGWIDPILVIGVVDRALRHTFAEPFPLNSSMPVPLGNNGKIDLGLVASSPLVNLRRQTGVVLRSGAIRNLHDLIMCIGMGADAVVPYLIFEEALHDAATPEEKLTCLKNTLKALQSGIEKCTSTMGIHESRGYGRLFASIGLSSDIASALGTSNYAGSEWGGLKLDDLDADIPLRASAYHSAGRGDLSRVNHFYPKIWKAAGKLGKGESDWGSYEAHVENTAKTNPVTIRNILDFHYQEEPSGIEPGQVDLGITSHKLPFLIASMSFGSQGEIAYRAYAEAAFRLNMLSINGEGGEIPDLLGKYPFNRGIQIASGRFGITAETINATNLLEIKVGQGAKPGEGGHLPARKVTAKVAAARHTRAGVDLISPSNNHDIYSIEDLAQFIEELKTINPKARVAVKVPVIPGIGIIAVGIAKADADIIYLTGYDGGTGAARAHSLRYVGLPAEIGVVEAHRALSESGLRGRVEIWADGGVRSAADAVKLMCLGANRVGLGSLPMVAIGCTICRDCQLGTCHTGITTQIETTDQAQAMGLKHFVPRDFEQATQALVNVFEGLGEAVRNIVARLGFMNAQDIVGRSNLLMQISHEGRIDLSEMLVTVDDYLNSKPIPVVLPMHEMAEIDRGPLHRPRNHLTTVISNLVMESFTTYQQDAIRFEDDKVTPVDRALGTHLTGALTRFRHNWAWLPGHGGVGGHRETWRQPLDDIDTRSVPNTALRFFSSSVPGNGLGAYNAEPVRILVEGGAQDGVAKGISGGRVVIMKGYNHDGKLIDGSVGKSLAYGGTDGFVIVQGDADSRACIRLSGADVIIGGEISKPLNDSLGFVGARANVKGFLCEYMTAGRVIVLGDPGPWICAGMTGGVLYLRLQPHLNFDQAAIQRRLAKGAKVVVQDVGENDLKNLRELLTIYAEELKQNHQSDEAQKVLNLLVDWKNTFVRVVPLGQQEEQRFATE